MCLPERLSLAARLRQLPSFLTVSSILLLFFFLEEVFYISGTLTLRIAILYSVIFEILFGLLPWPYPGMMCGVEILHPDWIMPYRYAK